MKKYSFSFLEEDSVELSKIAKEIDDVIYTDPHSAIVKSRLFAEKLLTEVINKENETYLNGQGYKQYEKIKMLAKEGFLPEFVERAFDNVRVIGNKAIHEGVNNDLEFAIKVHKNLYILAKWFMETYGKNYELEVPKYMIPEYKKNEVSINSDEIKAEIESKIEEKVKRYIEDLNKKKLIQEKGIIRETFENEEDKKVTEAAMKVLGFEYEDEILDGKKDEIVRNDGYVFKKSKGSYLLNELEKLSDSSQEAVESASSLDLFKKYLHVDRSIQESLEKSFFKAYREESAQILLLCGSVGDGKSHLLACLHDKYPEEFNKFKIHNDATESFGPNLNEIETLEKVLEQFSDENIEKSDEKLILAINLGVLHKFLEADFTKEKFSKFYKFIEQSGIFEEGTSKSIFDKGKFKLISFGDYSIYELKKEGAKSKYIESLLNKVINEDEENPFFKSYKLDKEAELVSPVIDNYEILKIDGVIEKISNLLVFIMVKYKRLISTRELFNFIYEILVPSNILDFDLGTADIEYVKTTLPNLLFETITRGPLLAVIANEDPIMTRSKKLDDFLININISTNIKESLKDALDVSLVRSVNSEISLIDNFNLVGESTKQQLIETIIRSMYLFGEKQYSEIFVDKEYREYINYLYNYNRGDVDNYINMFEEVKAAVFKWNGSPEEEYIYLNENLNSYKVSERLTIEPSDEIGICDEIRETELERFKGSITLGFELNGQVIPLIVDYELYKKLKMVTNGYCLSKNDKEEAVIFVEFIEKILKYGNMKKELLVQDLKDNESFKLTYKSMSKKFKFERVR